MFRYFSHHVPPISTICLPYFPPNFPTKLSHYVSIHQAFLLVFAAEIGDRSFISAAALSAQGGPEGAVAVFLGAISAHGVATLLAVALGDLISTYVSAPGQGMGMGKL